MVKGEIKRLEGVAADINNLSPLQIGYKRTCDCPPKNLNCLTAKEWIKAQIGVWEFYYEGRDIRDKNVHPAVFPISLAKQVISLFTHQGELVIDPFVGVGTTLLAASDLNRNAVGFDLYDRYIDTCKERLAQARLNEWNQKDATEDKLLAHDKQVTQERLTENSIEHTDGERPIQKHLFEEVSRQIPVLDDAMNINNYFEPEIASLVWTSPPYANLLNRPRLNKSRRGSARKNHQYLKIEQYGVDSRDLGLLTPEDYQQSMTEIFGRMRSVIKPHGHVVIDVPDMWWKDAETGIGKRIPLHINIYHALVDAGYEFRNTIIWNRRNIVNNVGIFGYPSNYITMGTTFEYLLDFWKLP